jgi:endonuclease/exonuclease/phosphatase family metal-dependent hydrolase
MMLPLIAALLLLPTLALGDGNSGELVFGCPDVGSTTDSTVSTTRLTVASLNIAHGRNDAFNQMFLDAVTIQGNLISVADLLRRSGAQVIALQEADAASRWSGNFDHVAYLGQASDHRCRAHGLHDSSRYSSYGTALLSSPTLHAAQSFSFASTPPTRTKGFVSASILWNPGGNLEKPVAITLVSVHLDFSRGSVRRSQIEQMTQQLASIDTPLVVMGDFNAQWEDKNSAVKLLSQNLKLLAHEPNSTSLGTYGDGNKRLDWILVSPQLQITNYQVAPDMVSDHQLVVAELMLATTP